MPAFKNQGKGKEPEARDEEEVMEKHKEGDAKEGKEEGFLAETLWRTERNGVWSHNVHTSTSHKHTEALAGEVWSRP